MVAEGEKGHKFGLLVYEVIGKDCEIVIFECMLKYSGVGTALLLRLREEARRRKCERIWLITTNDNLNAMRFYQRRGFAIAAFHKNAIDVSREMKPTIPETGDHEIPIRDEVEFEMQLGYVAEK